MERRLRFIEHVAELIEHENTKSVAVRLFMGVPSAFWDAPASSSGKYHPEYALGDGGLLRHTLVCIHVARDLAEAYGFSTDDLQMDAITLAAVFHDTYKGGDTGVAPWTETVSNHPELAAAQLRAAASHELFSRRMVLNWAADAVEGHMSMWGTSARPIDTLHPLAQIVSNADYIASRKYLVPSADLAELLAQYR